MVWISFALQLFLEGLDHSSILSVALFNRFLLRHRATRLGVGILGCLPPVAVMTGSTPTLRVFFRSRHHLSLKSQGFPPCVEGDQVNATLVRNQGHALSIRRTHPSADTSLDGLAVTMSRSIPSGPLAVKVVGMERRHLSWQKGVQWLERLLETPRSALACGWNENKR